MAPTYVSSVLLDTCWIQVCRIPTDDSVGDQIRSLVDPDATTRSLSDEIEELSSKPNGHLDFDDNVHDNPDPNHTKNDFLDDHDNADLNRTKNNLLDYHDDATDPNETKNDFFDDLNNAIPKEIKKNMLEDPNRTNKHHEMQSPRGDNNLVKENNFSTDNGILENSSPSKYDNTILNDTSFVYFEDFKILNGLIEENTNLKLFQPSDFALIYSQFEEQKEDPEATTMSKSDVIFFYDSLLDVKFTEDPVLLKNEPMNYGLPLLEYGDFMHTPRVFISSSLSSLNSPVSKIIKPKKPSSIAKTKLKTPVSSIYDKKDVSSFEDAFLNYNKFDTTGGSSFYKLQNEIYSKEHEIQYRDELISKLEIQLSQFEDKTKDFDLLNRKLNKEQSMNQQYNDELQKMTNDLADLQASFKGLKLKNENLVNENTELSGCITELVNKVLTLEKRQNDLIISSATKIIPESFMVNGSKNTDNHDKNIKDMDKKLAQLAKNHELENSKLLKKIELLEKNLVSSNLKINLFHEKFKTLKNNKLAQFNKLQSILQRHNVEKQNMLEDGESDENNENDETFQNKPTKSAISDYNFVNQSENFYKQLYRIWLSKFSKYINRYDISYKEFAIFYIFLIIVTLLMKYFLIFPFGRKKHDYDNSGIENSLSSKLLYHVKHAYLLLNPTSINHNTVDTLKIRFEYDPDFQMFVNQNN